MLIDAHVHLMAPMTTAELDDFCRAEPYWGLLLQPPGGRSIQGWATPERMLADMDAAGVDRVIIQGQYRRTHAACVAHNDQIIQVVRRWPARAGGFAVVQPLAGAAALDELDRCLDAGLCGVGELNPYAQGHSLRHPDFRRLAEACIARNIPLNLHVSEEVGHYYPGKSATPLRDYYWLAGRYPELRLILAHWGGGLFFYELMPSARRVLSNVCYDTAASPLLYPTADVFAVALRCVRPGKVLYGSDYPLRLFPRRQSKPDFTSFLFEVEAVDIPTADRRALLGENAARMFGVQSGDASADRPTATAEVVLCPPIHDFMAVTMVAEEWPQTQAVFERHGIPWRDSPVPDWEPIVQAAAAHGYPPHLRQRLLEELNAAIE
jgi:predicted TIM-barrel fold metal-dependent hydrolase